MRKKEGRERIKKKEKMTKEREYMKNIPRQGQRKKERKKERKKKVRQGERGRGKDGRKDGGNVCV